MMFDVFGSSPVLCFVVQTCVCACDVGLLDLIFSFFVSASSLSTNSTGVTHDSLKTHNIGRGVILLVSMKS